MYKLANPVAPRPHFVSLRRPRFVLLLSCSLLVIQGLGFAVLGTGRAGLGISECVLVLNCLLASASVAAAFRRAQGLTAVFWALFSVVMLILLVPTALQAADTLLTLNLVADTTRALMYCLYGAPIVMMLFLPAGVRRARMKSEIMLDLFQVAIVVAMIYSTFFFLPEERMLPADAVLHNITISDAQSLLLLLAALVRLQFVRLAGARDLLNRLAFFLLVCALVTLVGDWIFLARSAIAIAWFDLGWSLPLVAAGWVAVNWQPAADTQFEPEDMSPIGFLSFLGANLVLVAMLSCTVLLMDRWKQAQGAALTGTAIAASLLAFTLRLSLTQFHQEQEIGQRKKAQLALTTSHQKVGRLLDEARRQAGEINQISELGGILQVCTSRKEMFRLIPERLRRLFPGASGCIAMLSASKNRAESVAVWGVSPTSQIFSPEQCWALRRGTPHAHPGGVSEPRCSHLLGDGPSICIPLVANGDTFGALVVQSADRLIPSLDPEADSGSFARCRQLAAAISEQISLAMANLNLRETLRTEAVRDSLTGLYNRRYMEEFFDREIHAARRKSTPVAIMLLDLDRFKRYNDSFGHAAGDRVLTVLGECLVRCLRAADVACRYGGERFLLILPGCSLRRATERADQIRQQLKEFRARHDQQPIDCLTVSIGVAAFDETTDRTELLIKFAEDAVAEAKRLGRDRVVGARAVPPSAESAAPDQVSAALAQIEAHKPTPA
jgi:diguanylate cyclase (GGDEF)-like protein